MLIKFEIPATLTIQKNNYWSMHFNNGILSFYFSVLSSRLTIPKLFQNIYDQFLTSFFVESSVWRLFITQTEDKNIIPIIFWLCISVFVRKSWGPAKKTNWIRKLIQNAVNCTAGPLWECLETPKKLILCEPIICVLLLSTSRRMSAFSFEGRHLKVMLPDVKTFA